MNPGCFNLIGLECPKGNGAEDLVEIGVKERIDGLSQTRCRGEREALSRSITDLACRAEPDATGGLAGVPEQ